MNVEELQWRIRHNYHLPVDIYSRPVNERDETSMIELEKTDEGREKDRNTEKESSELFSNNVENLEQVLIDNQVSNSNTDCERQGHIDVQEETAGDTFETTRDNDVIHPGDKDDQSPSSDICVDYDSIETVADEDNDDNNNVADTDVDSYDEGLGDIDHSESPELKKVVFDNISNESCDGSAKTVSPEAEKERRPSRISFETPL